MSVAEEFIAYLEGKNIDAKAFKLGDPSVYQEWETYFGLVHPKSFTAQKFYLINSIRRRFQLPEGAKPKVTKKKTVAKPSVKPTASKGVNTTPLNIPKPKGVALKVPVPKKSATAQPKIPGVKKSSLSPKIPSKQIDDDSGVKDEVKSVQPKKVMAPKIPGVKKSSLSPKIPSKQIDDDSGVKDEVTSVSPKKVIAPKLPNTKDSKKPLAPKIPPRQKRED